MAKSSRKKSKGKQKSSKSKKPQDKKKYIKSWSDEKVEEVWEGHKKGDFELGKEDLEILKTELENRKLGPYEEDEEEQVPIGYIKIYPETPERNEFYKKRYANAKKAWPNSKIITKGETWFIVAKGDAEHGYDVHLFFTSDGTVHGTCTCADFAQRGIRRTFPCKHIFMVLVHQGLTKKWEDVE